MSVFHPDEYERDATLPESEQSAYLYRPSEICWVCAKVLRGGEHLVVAHGYEGSPYKDSWDGEQYVDPQIWMHVDCAHDLALKLLKDYLTVKQIRDHKEACRELGVPEDDEP